MDSAGIVLIISLVMICIALPMAIKSTKKASNEANDIYSSLKRNIQDTYDRVIGEGELSTNRQLDKLWTFALEKVRGVLNSYEREHNIVDKCESFSNLGLCGVSTTHFFVKLDKTNFSEYDRLYLAGNLNAKYNEFLSYVSRSTELATWIPQKSLIASQITQHLPAYLKLKQSECLSNAQAIPLEDIIAFRVEGSRHISTNISDGGPNLRGAAAGALIAGDAGAIIGSRMAVQQITTTTTIDERKILLVYNLNGTVVTQKIESTEKDKTIDALRKLIPQKEESVLKLNGADGKHTVQLSAADELKKFKDLLDCGIITQEEFDAKKKQLLGL